MEYFGGLAVLRGLKHGIVDQGRSPAQLTEKHGGGFDLLLQGQEQRMGRQVLKAGAELRLGWEVEGPRCLRGGRQGHTELIA
jgi:hypothetical protein